MASWYYTEVTIPVDGFPHDGMGREVGGYRPGARNAINHAYRKPRHKLKSKVAISLANRKAITAR
jgi:hypothetical protein